MSANSTVEDEEEHERITIAGGKSRAIEMEDVSQSNFNDSLI